MTRLVLNVVGDDRPGLVHALSNVVVEHGGNWEECQLADVDGRFAGLVVVTVPDMRAGGFTTALGGIDTILHVTFPGTQGEVTYPTDVAVPEGLSLHLLGDDRPGIVHEVADTLVRLGASISRMETRTRATPESGGALFEADLYVTLPPDTDPGVARDALESLAHEIMVDISVGV